MTESTIQENADLEKCIHFLNSIGIPTTFRKIEEGSFLPGLMIEKGGLVIDKEALTHPGDILHEAGHIAVTPGKKRPKMNHNSIVKSSHREAEEMMAIAWSYAACIHLGLDPYFVFHDHGYKGGGDFIVENFRDKKYFGTPMLQ